MSVQIYAMPVCIIGEYGIYGVVNIEISVNQKND